MSGNFSKAAIEQLVEMLEKNASKRSAGTSHRRDEAA